VRVTRLSTCLLVLVASPVLSSAQAQQPSQNQPSPPTANEKPVTPAGATDPKAKKPKKVWTEEEMGKLSGSISVVGDKNASGSGSASSGTAQGDHDAAWFRDQLAPLRSQMERIDSQIRDLEQAKLGGRENIARSLEKLQQQKADLQAKIDVLEEQGRKAGIAPGELR
jgi:hypothetical protein